MGTQETCRRGHPRTPENTYQYPRKDGSIRVMCQRCNKLKDKSKHPVLRRHHPNEYRIEKDVAYLKLANGYEAIVDTAYLEKVLSCARWRSNGRDITNCDTKRHIQLHRLITDASEEQLVIFVNGNRLDCRSSNLRLVTKSEVQQGRPLIGRESLSGHKNVRWIKSNNRWRVCVILHGKAHYGGHYTEIDEAIRAASELRRRLHECCPENSLSDNG